MVNEQSSLISIVHDQDLIDYFYLQKPLDELVDIIEGLTFSKCGNCHDIPFNASVKGYLGAVDNNDQAWIVKPIIGEKDTLYHRITQLVYLLDFQMATLSTPTMVLTIDGKKYRGAKVVPNCIQISSYDYLKQPFLNILTKDLINRWLQFDEDRNPNNYMVLRNSKDYPLVVAIDFDKSDLESEENKIVGTDDKFGWIRHEKNRYLTMLKTENFDRVPLSVFEKRLELMMAIDLTKFGSIATRLLEGYCPDPKAKAQQIMANIKKRREYINSYFRKWFNDQDQGAIKKEEDAYSEMGATFMKMYRNSK